MGQGKCCQTFIWNCLKEGVWLYLHLMVRQENHLLWNQFHFCCLAGGIYEMTSYCSSECLKDIHTTAVFKVLWPRGMPTGMIGPQEIVLVWGLLLEGRCYGNDRKSVIWIQPASDKGAVQASWCGGSLTFSCVSHKKKPASGQLSHRGFDDHIAETQIRFPSLLSLPLSIIRGSQKQLFLCIDLELNKKQRKGHNSLF